jgi:hypothetical protein
VRSSLASVRGCETRRTPLLRLRTVACALLTALCVWAAAALFTDVVRCGEEPVGIVMAGLALGAFTLLPASFALAWLCEDVAFAAVRGRRTPKSALKAFFRALRLGYFEYAYDCILPEGRDGGPRHRRAVRGIGVGDRLCDFSTIDGFRDYWRDLARPPSYGAKLRSGGYRVERQSDNAVRISCVVSLGLALVIWQPWAAFWRPVWLNEIHVRPPVREDLRVCKVLRRSGDRWYLTSGELRED